MLVVLRVKNQSPHFHGGIFLLCIFCCRRKKLNTFLYYFISTLFNKALKGRHTIAMVEAHRIKRIEFSISPEGAAYKYPMYELIKQQLL